MRGRDGMQTFIGQGSLERRAVSGLDASGVIILHRF